MFREFEGARASGTLRLWTAGDGRGDLKQPGIAAEWVGHAGHPSSYGLLGGHIALDGHGGIAIAQTGTYANSLAGVADQVEFGLPGPYAGWAVRELGTDVVVTVAAHGLQGSSPVVFMWLGRVLSVLLRQGMPSDDAEVFTLWAAARERPTPKEASERS